MDKIWSWISRRVGHTVIPQWLNKVDDVIDSGRGINLDMELSSDAYSAVKKMYLGD